MLPQFLGSVVRTPAQERGIHLYVLFLVVLTAETMLDSAERPLHFLISQSRSIGSMVWAKMTMDTLSPSLSLPLSLSHCSVHSEYEGL